MLRLIFLILSLMPATALMTGCIHVAIEAGHYPDPLRFEPDIVRFEAADRAAMPPTGAIVCTGSSSIFFWHDTLAHDLAPLTVIPRGFGGSTYYDLLHYLDRAVLAYHPRAVVIYEGDNDIAEDITPHEILKVFRQVIGRIHQALPEARIYILSIKPSESRWTLWPLTKKTNRLLKWECAKDPLMTWIDVATPLLGGDGQPRADLFREDRLHLNRAGYELWREAVRPALLKGELARQ